MSTEEKLNQAKGAVKEKVGEGLEVVTDSSSNEKPRVH